MKIKFRLLYKMIFFLLGASALIYVAVINLIKYDFHKSAVRDSRAMADACALQYANGIELVIKENAITTKSLSQIKAGKDLLSSAIQNILFTNLSRSTLKSNPDILSVWTSWRISALNSSYDKPYGRVIFQLSKNKSSINEYTDSTDIYGFDSVSDYFKVYSEKTDLLFNPVFKSYSGKKIDEMYVASVISPIMDSNAFYGAVGLDFNMEVFQSMVDTIKPLKNSYSFLLTSNGNFGAHPIKKMIHTGIENFDPEGVVKHDIKNRISKGESFSYIVPSVEGQDSLYVTFAPVKFTEKSPYWSFVMVVPLQIILQETKSHFQVSITVGLIGIGILLVLLYIISLTIIVPVKRITKTLQLLTNGEINHIEHVKLDAKDEVGQMAESLQTVVESIRATAGFANQIGSGNFDAQHKLLSDNDILGKAIVEMRNSLKKAKIESDARRKNEENITWASVGITEFGKILRFDNDNLNKLTYNVIRFLTKYLDAHEGGLYLVNDQDPSHPYLELKAWIGFDTAKSSKTYIEPGDSLIGRCFLEKDTVFITEIPPDYLKITSGLGKSDPSSILLVPLILNEVIVGIVELAALKVFEEYEIKFVEKISVSIANTISRVKINVRTASLLEQSKIQADELAQREEEIRQNMEELQATQEEANHRENEMRGIIDAIKSTLLVTEYDIEGKITDINEGMLKIYKLNKDQIIGKIFGFKLADEKKQDKLKEFWAEIKSGRTKTNIQYYRTASREIWLDEIYTPIFDSFGNPTKVLCIAFDITEARNKRQKLKQLNDKRDVLLKKSKLGEGQVAKKDIDVLLTDDFDFEYIDLSYLNKVYKGDAQKIHNILNFYLVQIPEELDEINRYFKEKNWELLRTKANNFKTKMTYLGLKVLFNNAKNIERYSNEKINLTEIPELITEIHEVWSQAEKELKTIIKSISEIL